MEILNTFLSLLIKETIYLKKLTSFWLHVFGQYLSNAITVYKENKLRKAL